MEKKIPKVFANPDSKGAGNNKEVFYSSNERNIDNELYHDSKGDSFRHEFEKKVKTKNINQKINDIFNSSRYVYKADVEITLKDNKVIKKRIVRNNANYLITIENELIPISDIVDINYK